MEWHQCKCGKQIRGPASSFCWDCTPPERRTVDWNEEELFRLRRVIEGDRSEIAEIYTDLKAVFRGRDWLIHSRGSYAYDDDRYRQEFAGAMLEFEQVINRLIPLVADWSDCPVDSHEVQQARRERAQKRNKG